ncbi:MAG TPA: copper resistance protein CopC [Candidatus Sulfotelmatobacter sp.]|nr:copper resistance protein CopC [Candidatus Sulfotelmatobacter sp.]
MAALLPQGASAHAQLLQSNPAPDSVLQSVATTVTLIFNEPVTPAGAGIKVFSPTGNQVAAPATARGSVLSAALRSSETGTYVVSWQILAADTHPSRGAFRFVVGRSSANPYSTLLDSPEIGTATPLGLALQALARLVHFVGFALVFGIVGYQALIQPGERFVRLTGAGVILLIAAEPIALLGQLASLSFDGDTALAVLDSSFGRLLGLRLGAALLVWTLIASRRYRVLLGLGVVVAVLDGLSAHAIPGLPGAGQLLVAVHVCAMGLWVGGLVAFVRAPDRRFARYAVATLSIAVGTGIVLALIHTGFGSGLLTTAYGRVLLLKVVVVGTALSAAILRRHRPELAAALLVVAAAALLAALPPVV